MKTKFAGTSVPQSAVVRRYFHRCRAHGKRLLARILDAVLLLVIVFAAVWLYLYGKGLHARHALLAAWFVTLFVAVLCRMHAVFAMQRFVPKETERLARELLRRRLPFMEHTQYLALCCRASGCAVPIVFRTAEAVGADTLLPYLREMTGTPLVFCACADFTDTAKALAAERRETMRLVGAEALLDAAMRQPQLRPNEEEVYRHIEAQEAARKQRSRHARAFPQDVGSRRYLIAAGLLFLFSFWTGHTLYYRMLSGLCLSLAFLRGVLGRTSHATGAH